MWVGLLVKFSGAFLMNHRDEKRHVFVIELVAPSCGRMFPDHNRLAELKVSECFVILARS